MSKNVDDMSVAELEMEAGVEEKQKARKQAVVERLYEHYKNVGKK